MGCVFGAARVLFITQLDPSHKFGSLEECILALATRSKARGGLLVAVFSGPVIGTLRAQLTASDVPFEEFLDLRSCKWGLAKRLLHLIDSHSMDLVDFSFYAPLNPYVTFLRIMRPRVRLVYTEHRSALPEAPRSGSMRRLLKRLAFRQYQALFGISDSSCEALQRSSGREVTRCRLFINTARFRADSSARAEIRSRLGAGNQFVALVVAHLIVWKGVDVALKAIAAASDSAQLWIVGAGPDVDRLRTLADELGLHTRTLFVGQQIDVSPYLQGADCLVCPSIWKEAMGFVNLEAMACGLPVIASRTGGIAELVADGRTGFLVAPGSDEQVAAALRGLMESPDLCRKLGNRGVTFVREQYSQEACLDRYLKNYDLVCGIASHRVDRENVGYGRNRNIA